MCLRPAASPREPSELAVSGETLGEKEASSLGAGWQAVNLLPGRQAEFHPEFLN